MESYKQLLQYVLDNGEDHDDRTGVGTTSVFGTHWAHDMRKGFPLLTLKAVPLRLVFEELMWMLRGSSDAKELKDRNVHIWNEWSTKEQCAKFGREENDLGPVYGVLWRKFPYVYKGEYGPQVVSGVDQISHLLENIKNNPNSRRLMVSAWHPAHVNDVPLPPCHYGFQIKCHERTKEMSMIVNMRSVDCFLGMPFDIALYAVLLMLLAKITGYTPKKLLFNFGDTHIYNNHIDQVKEMLGRSSKPLPSLSIADTDKYLRPLDQLLSVHWSMLTLNNYNPHPKIKAPVAV